MRIIRLALAYQANRLDRVIKEFPNASKPVITDRRAEIQALRDKLVFGETLVLSDHTAG
jgi:hypothetical protein